MRFLIAAAAMLLAVPAHAQEWWEAETDHFIVKSRDSETSTRKFAEELERYDGALRTLQNIADKEVARANKVTIFRFGDTGDIAHIAGYPGSGIAGFYIGRAGNSVAFVPVREDRDEKSIVRQSRENQLDGMSVLKHEYAHHFMMQYFPGAYPLWYVEGYAETVATIRFLDDGSFHVGDPPQYRAYQVMRLPAFRLREMLDANHELSGYDGIQHYGTGWLLSHYLNFDTERRAKLISFLSAVAAGEDSLTVAQRILGDLNALDRELSRYRRGPFPGLNVKPANYIAPVVSMNRMGADETALIEAKMRLWRGVDEDEARSIRNTIAGRIADYPQSVEAHLLLAEASFDAEDFAASEQAAAKAVALDPGSVRGWLYRGMAAASAGDPRAGRRHLAEAAKIDLADPRPRIAFYRTYLDAGEEAPENALIALEDAFDFAGSDPEYRFLLGRQLLTEQRFADARTVVLPAVFVGHATGEADADPDDPTPRRLLSAIDSQDVAAAIAIIDKILDPDDEDNGG